ncbi:MAG TPA: GAF domain-containing protein [Gammaproteobacteria bacterium]|nr:GAF domain-containing protein [Gammaproteobacteria bacterium]
MSETGNSAERHLKALNEIARIASGDLELRPMLARVTEALYRHFGWDFIAFASVDKERQRFVCEAVRSEVPTSITPGFTRPLGLGVVGEVAASGKPALYDDVTQVPHYMETTPGVRAQLCVPVRHRGEVIAVLNVESTRQGAFCDQLPILETVAEQVAGPIDAARVYETLMEHAVLNEVMSEVSRIALEPLSPPELLQQIADYINAHFPLCMPSIMLLDDAGRNFVVEVFAQNAPRVAPAGEWSVDTGISGRCVRTGEAIYIEDVAAEPAYVSRLPGMRAEFVVPIRYRGRVLGVLNLESANPQGFTPHARQVFTSIAEQIAGAIEGARLNAALREHTRVMETLNRLSRLATQGDDLHALLRKVTDYLAVELGVAVASILVLDDSGARFIIETMSGEMQLGIPGGDEWRTSVGVCGRCARTGEPQLVYADAGDPDYVVGHPDVRSEYVVPIRYHERTLGVLNLESTARDSFTPQVQSLCRAVADQVAGAIHVALVNRELADANDKLKRANLELHRISSYDALTGVPNRRRLDEVLAHEWRWATRTGRPLTLMLADLDHFKALNDSHGHLRGDECLKLVAQALADGLMRPADFVARYGGEEFALVLPDLDPEQARGYAESLRARVEALRLAHGSSQVSEYVTLSIGTASLVASRGVPASELVAAADAALYAAKKAGRNRVMSHDGLAEG